MDKRSYDRSESILHMMGRTSILHPTEKEFLAELYIRRFPNNKVFTKEEIENGSHVPILGQTS